MVPSEVSARICTWSTLPTTSGSVPGRASAEATSEEPPSGPSSLSCPRTFQPDHVPWFSVRTCTTSALEL